MALRGVVSSAPYESESLVAANPSRRLSHWANPSPIARSSQLRPARCPRSKGPGLSPGAFFAGDFAWDFTSGLHFGTSRGDVAWGTFAAGLRCSTWLEALARRGLSTWRPGDRQTGY